MTGKSDVEQAEALAGARSGLLLAMAAVLIGSEVLALRDVDDPLKLGVWALLVLCTALLLVPGGYWAPPRVAAMLHDEGTQVNRRLGVETGFWVALASGLGVAVVSLFEPLSAGVGARVVVTAALAAALIGFAVRERQATA